MSRPSRPRSSPTARSSTFAALLVAALLVGASACSDDGSADGDAATSAPGDATTTDADTAAESDADADADATGDATTEPTEAEGGGTPDPADCTATTVATTPDLAYRELPGVDPELLSLDLSVPDLPDDCPDPPVFVWVHGGGFSIGDKGNQVEDKIRLAAANGWAFASVNYRLSPEPGSIEPDPVRHPDHAEDVAAAVAWVRDEGTDHGVDGSRIALVGHSAGAFLVSLVGTDDSFLAATGGGLDDLGCVVSLDTTYDVAARVASGGQAEAVYRSAFGDDPDVWRDASPIVTATTGGAPPFLVVTQGSATRTGGSEAFAQAVRAAGGTAELLDATPLDHAEVNRVIGTPGDDVVTPVFEPFVADCLATS